MMDLQKLRKLVTLFVFGIFSLIMASIIVRIFLRVIGANESNAIVAFIYNVSGSFIDGFRGAYPNISINGDTYALEIFAVLAIMFYVILAFLISRLLKSFLDTDVVNIITHVIDTGFKAVEFVLITRFMFKLTGASVQSSFVDTIYNMSNVIYVPFKDVIPAQTIEVSKLIFEPSTLIAIIIIIIFDAAMEGVINYVRKMDKDAPSKPKAPKPAPAQPQPNFTFNIPQQEPAKQQAPNIMINVPQLQQQPQYIQPPQPQYVDQRTIHVVSPQAAPAHLPQPQPQNYPYFAGNQAEQMRPPRNPNSQIWKHNQGNPNAGFYNQPMAPRNANPGSANS